MRTMRTERVILRRHEWICVDGWLPPVWKYDRSFDGGHDL
jgi:hypothetical protein